MECTLIEGELIPFHFGTLEGESRARLETHLVGCATCLGGFLEVKRAIELGRELSRRPSPALRQRLRAELQASFVRPTRRDRRLTFVTASAAVAAALLGFLLLRGPARPPAEERVPIATASRFDPAGAPVDTARPLGSGPLYY